MDNLNELLEKRAALLSQAENLIEGVEPGSAEAATVDSLIHQIRDIDARVTALEQATGQAEADEAVPASRSLKPVPRSPNADLQRRRSVSADAFMKESFRMTSTSESNAIRSWLKIGSDLESRGDLQAISHFGTSGLLTLRAPTSGLVSNAPVGSHLVPQTLLSRYESYLKSYCKFFDIARVFNTSAGEDLRIPINSDSRGTNAIGSFVEQLQPDDDKMSDLAQKTLKSYTASSGIVKFSWELLADSAVDVSNLVADQLSQRLGRLFSKCFTTGTGVNEPSGLLLNAGQAGGIPAIDTATAGAVGLDDLIKVFSALDPAHQGSPSCFWMLSPSVYGSLLSLKDGALRPYLQPEKGDIIESPAGTLLGRKIVLNPDMDDLASGKMCVVVGDFSYFAIRKVGDLNLRRTDEKWWEYRATGFRATQRVDSCVLDTEAFRVLRVK